jgi:hypothetical protein
LTMELLLIYYIYSYAVYNTTSCNYVIVPFFPNYTRYKASNPFSHNFFRALISKYNHEIRKIGHLKQQKSDLDTLEYEPSSQSCRTHSESAWGVCLLRCQTLDASSAGGVLCSATPQRKTEKTTTPLSSNDRNS